MKIKIEIDLTPEEAQDLFIPSSKQKEFAKALYDAYIESLTKAASGAFSHVFKRNGTTKKRVD